MKKNMSKTGLALFLLMGVLLIFLGLKGQQEFAASGFSSESAYQAIHRLSREVDQAWKRKMQPALKQLSEDERESLYRTAEALLADTSAGTANEDAAQASERSADDADIIRVLSAAYLLDGPKIENAERKKIAAMAEDEAAKFRLKLLCCAAGETSGTPGESSDIPEEIRKTAGKKEGLEQKAVFMMAFFTSGGLKDSRVTESVNLLKKSVRGKDRHAGVIRMIASGEISWMDAQILSRSRTVVLFGVLIVLDALLLALLMRAERRWAFDVKWIFILLILDFMLVFQLLPLIFILWRAVFPEGTFSLDTLRRLVTYPMNREALKNTLIAAFASMVFGTAFAFPLAWLVGRTDLYGRKLFRWLFVLSYMVPPYVGAMAWLRLMNPNVGTINQWLRMLFRLGDGPGPLNVYTLPGIIWVLTTFYYPYAFITVSRAMEKMDPSLEEAARVSGASPFRTVLTVTLPLMTPSLIAGALLVFISAASCYGIPSIIGTPGNVSTVTTRIVEYVALGQQGMNDATALSVFLMGTAVLILFISEVVLAKKQYITVSGKSVRPAIVELRAFRIPLTILVALFAGLVIFLPFFTILTTSFKVDIGKNIFAPGNFTLVNWTTVFNRGETMSCLKNSFLFASAAATVGLLIAVLMSWLLQRTRVRGRGIPAFLITLGSGTPSVVIALGLIMTMRGNFGINIYGTAYIMIIAYMIKYMLMGMRTVVSALSQIHQSLEESSLASGAGWLYTMRKINVPLILPSVAASWFLIFIPSFYELSMTTLLYSTTTKTIGFQLYEYWTFTSQPMSCAMAFGILMIVVALNFLLGKITGGALSISG